MSLQRQLRSNRERVRNFVLPNPSQTVTTESSGTVYATAARLFIPDNPQRMPGGYSQYSIPYSVAIYDTSEDICETRFNQF